MDSRKHRLALALALLGILALPAALEAAGPADSTDSLEASLRAAESAFAEAFAARDRERFAAMIAPDAIFFSGDRALRGREAVMEEWGKLLAAETPPFSWRPDRVAVRAGGDEGVTTGPVFGPDGTWSASFVSVWRRTEDGGWQVVFDVGPRCPPGGLGPSTSPPAKH